MSHGLCVLGHDIGGIPELVKHDNTGLLYQNDSIMIEHLVELTNDEVKVRRLGDSGRNQFFKDYLLESCSKRYLDLYQSATVQPS